MLDLIKQGIGVLIALVVAFGLLRPLLRGLSRAPVPGKGLAMAQPSMPQTISVRMDDDDGGNELDRLSISPAVAYEQRIGLARRMVGENPKQVAQVVKNWVVEDGG